MAQKKYDAVVRVGEYTDRNGETKARWLNVGAVLQTDNGHCLLLDRTFNPAGIADPENRGNVMISLFEPNRDGPRPPQNNGSTQPSRGGQETPPPPDDSDIPF